MKIEKSIKQKRFKSPHQKLMINILFTANWLDGIIRKLLSQYKITHIQFNILRILAGTYPKPLCAGDIKEVMVFRNSDTTRLVDRLELKGLVSRIISPDNRRKMDIKITEEGLKLLEKINPKIEDIQRDYFEAKLSSDEAVYINDKLDFLRSI